MTVPSRIAFFLFFALTSALPAAAQVASTWAIGGTVTDSTGAAVPGAAVKITNTSTGVSRTLETNEAGFYSAESTITGTYDIEVSKAGFRGAIVKGLVVDPGSRVSQNIGLTVSGVNNSRRV